MLKLVLPLQMTAESLTFKSRNGSTACSRPSAGKVHFLTTHGMWHPCAGGLFLTVRKNGSPKASNWKKKTSTNPKIRINQPWKNEKLVFKKKGRPFLQNKVTKWCFFVDAALGFHPFFLWKVPGLVFSGRGKSSKMRSLTWVLGICKYGMLPPLQDVIVASEKFRPEGRPPLKKYVSCHHAGH